MSEPGDNHISESRNSQASGSSLFGSAEEARSAAKYLRLSAVAIALMAIAAGISQHAQLALWCLPLFVAIGIAANSATQTARRLTHGPSAPPDVNRQVAEGLLGGCLLLVFLVLLGIGWVFYELSQWH